MIYLAVAAGAAGAAVRTAGDRRRLKGWLAIAAWFVILASFRFLALEDILRAELREVLQSSGALVSRRMVQWPVSIAALVAGGLVCRRLIGRIVRVGPFSRLAALDWALLASAGMLCLLLIRIVSLHALDKLLFSPVIGPLRINWMIDIGLGAVVLVSAMAFLRRPPGRQG